MTTARVVETSVTVNNNSPIQDYVHTDNHIPPAYDMNPAFKALTSWKCSLEDIIDVCMVGVGGRKEGDNLICAVTIKTSAKFRESRLNLVSFLILRRPSFSSNVDGY